MSSIPLIAPTLRNPNAKNKHSRRSKKSWVGDITFFEAKVPLFGIPYMRDSKNGKSLREIMSACPFSLEEKGRKRIFGTARLPH